MSYCRRLRPQLHHVKRVGIAGKYICSVRIIKIPLSGHAFIIFAKWVDWESKCLWWPEGISSRTLLQVAKLVILAYLDLSLLLSCRMAVINALCPIVSAATTENWLHLYRSRMLKMKSAVENHPITQYVRRIIISGQYTAYGAASDLTRTAERPKNGAYGRNKFQIPN